MRTLVFRTLMLIIIVTEMYSCTSFDHEYHDYIEYSAKMAIAGKIDSIDLQALKMMHNVYTINNDSENVCTLNMIFGIINYNTSRQDSALYYLLNAEQFSDCCPELKPHIYYYLASAFIDYDPILAKDIIENHQEYCLDEYDYSRFLNLNVTSQERNTHSINSVYYSRMIQRSLDTMKKQQKTETRLYLCIIIITSILLLLAAISIILILRYKVKTVNLVNSVAHQKNNFNTLLVKYMELYRSNCNRDTVYADANTLLSVLRNTYTALSKSDIAIIWLIILSFSREEICSALIIGKEYYHQRRTHISKTLKLGSTRNLDNDLKTFVPEFLSDRELR